VKKKVVARPTKKSDSRQNTSRSLSRNFGGTDVQAKAEGPVTTEQPEYLNDAEQKKESSEEHVEQQMTDWLATQMKLQKLLNASGNSPRPTSAAVVKEEKKIDFHKEDPFDMLKMS